MGWWRQHFVFTSQPNYSSLPCHDDDDDDDDDVAAAYING